MADTFPTRFFIGYGYWGGWRREWGRVSGECGSGGGSTHIGACGCGVKSDKAGWIIGYWSGECGSGCVFQRILERVDARAKSDRGVLSDISVVSAGAEVDQRILEREHARRKVIEVDY